MITRRKAIKTAILTAGALTVAPSFLRAQNPGMNTGTTPSNPTGPFKLPELGYAYNALEPYIDAQTMQIHHDKHNAAYVDNLNKAIAEAPLEIRKWSVEELLTNLDRIPEKIRTTVRNNAGGQYNHSFFWKILKKNPNGKPTGELAKAIDTCFGSYLAFQDKFTEAATNVFGSGWAWLVLDGIKLVITSTPNQDTTICKIDAKQQPIVGLDVWEHAYYLKHQNRRPEYIKAFWNVINWDYAAERYISACKST